MIEGEPNASWDIGKQAHGTDPPPANVSPNHSFTRSTRRASCSRPAPNPSPPISASTTASQGWTSPEAYRQALSTEGKLTLQARSAAVETYRKRCELMKLKIIAGILGVALGTLTKRDAAYQLALAQKRARVRNAVLAVVSLLGASSPSPLPSLPTCRKRKLIVREPRP